MELDFEDESFSPKEIMKDFHGHIFWFFDGEGYLLFLSIDGWIEVWPQKGSFYLSSPFDFTTHEYIPGPHCNGMPIPETELVY